MHTTLEGLYAPYQIRESQTVLWQCFAMGTQALDRVRKVPPSSTTNLACYKQTSEHSRHQPPTTEGCKWSSFAPSATVKAVGPPLKTPNQTSCPRPQWDSPPRRWWKGPSPELRIHDTGNLIDRGTWGGGGTNDSGEEMFHHKTARNTLR